MSIPEIIISVAILIAGVFAIATSISLWRAPDALTRANLMGPTIGVAVPLTICAKLLHDWTIDGFDPNNFVRAILAITGLLAVAAVSSFYMARAVHSLDEE